MEKKFLVQSPFIRNGESLSMLFFSNAFPNECSSLRTFICRSIKGISKNNFLVTVFFTFCLPKVLKSSSHRIDGNDTSFPTVLYFKSEEGQRAGYSIQSSDYLLKLGTNTYLLWTRQRQISSMDWIISISDQCRHEGWDLNLKHVSGYPVRYLFPCGMRIQQSLLLKILLQTSLLSSFLFAVKQAETVALISHPSTFLLPQSPNEVIYHFPQNLACTHH